MATAPMMKHGIKVDLPETETKAIKSKEDPLVLFITKQRDIFIENYKIPYENLGEKLRKIYAQRQDKELFLEADKEVPYGFVIKVMSQVKKAGIIKVGMITVPLKK